MSITQYFKETKAEVKNIKWPTKKDTTLHTVLVIVISILVGVSLSGLDIGLQKAMTALLANF